MEIFVENISIKTSTTGKIIKYSNKQYLKKYIDNLFKILIVKLFTIDDNVRRV